MRTRAVGTVNGLTDTVSIPPGRTNNKQMSPIVALLTVFEHSVILPGASRCVKLMREFRSPTPSSRVRPVAPCTEPCCCRGG